MNLKLKKISSHGKNDSVITLDIETEYGFQDESFNDIVRIQYNSSTAETYVTVKARNQGVALVVQRIIELLSGHGSAGASGNPVGEMIEILAQKAGMDCDEDLLRQGYFPPPAGNSRG